MPVKKTDTKSRVIKNKDKLTYGSLRKEVEKPYRERRAMSVGRSGRQVRPRKYHLTASEKLEVIETAKSLGRATPNPFSKRIGPYYAAVEALIQLGIDEFHDFKTVFSKIREILESHKDEKTGQTAWDRACNRRSKPNATKPKTIHGKIETNFEVLQRLPRADKVERNPYGAKLAQFGMSIDIRYVKPEIEGVDCSGLEPVAQYKLNTGWGEWDPNDLSCHIVPLRENPFKKRRRRKAAQSSVTDSNNKSEAEAENNNTKAPGVSEASQNEDKGDDVIGEASSDVINEKKDESGDEGKIIPPDALHDDFD